jgi:hypothetical protein
LAGSVITKRWLLAVAEGKAFSWEWGAVKATLLMLDSVSNRTNNLSFMGLPLVMRIKRFGWR